jgi:phosphoserine aminotransferase
MLDYNVAAENGSMYNTPPCWPIYVCGLVFQHLLKLGGLAGQLADVLHCYVIFVQAVYLCRLRWVC